MSDLEKELDDTKKRISDFALKDEGYESDFDISSIVSSAANFNDTVVQERRQKVINGRDEHIMDSEENYAR